MYLRLLLTSIEQQMLTLYSSKLMRNIGQFLVRTEFITGAAQVFIGIHQKAFQIQKYVDYPGQRQPRNRLLSHLLLSRCAKYFKFIRQWLPRCSPHFEENCSSQLQVISGFSCYPAADCSEVTRHFQTVHKLTFMAVADGQTCYSLVHQSKPVGAERCQGFPEIRFQGGNRKSVPCHKRYLFCP